MYSFVEDWQMATMNVSLPEQMKSWVEDQAKTGRFSNASDYVRDLIRRDQERAAGRARLDAMFEDGWQSGISDASLDEVRETARRLAATGVRRAV